MIVVKEAVERYTPKRPKAMTVEHGACPQCGSLVSKHEGDERLINNCKWCGQALDWDIEGSE